jgi:hypothetical protein
MVKRNGNHQTLSRDHPFGNVFGAQGIERSWEGIKRLVAIIPLVTTRLMKHFFASIRIKRLVAIIPLVTLYLSCLLDERENALFARGFLSYKVYLRMQMR